MKLSNNIPELDDQALALLNVPSIFVDNRIKINMHESDPDNAFGAASMEGIFACDANGMPQQRQREAIHIDRGPADESEDGRDHLFIVLADNTRDEDFYVLILQLFTAIPDKEEYTIYFNSADFTGGQYIALANAITNCKAPVTCIANAINSLPEFLAWSSAGKRSIIRPFTRISLSPMECMIAGAMPDNKFVIHSLENVQQQLLVTLLNRKLITNEEYTQISSSNYKGLLYGDELLNRLRQFYDTLSE